MQATSQERSYGALAHAAPMVAGLIPFGSLAVALALWWWHRRSRYVVRHAQASINFQLSMLLYYGLGLGYVHVYAVFGLTLLLSSVVFETVSIVLAARRARAGGYYEYRLCLQFVKLGRAGVEGRA